MKKIAIFASGNGTNAERIIEYFNNNANICIDVVIVNKKDAYVRERAKRLGIEEMYFNKEEFYNSNIVLETLKKKEIDLIVLAGFLWLIPENLLANFHNRIINIHPALLPNYGGKGMYGQKVHKAVIDNKEKESGITIHYVNKEYDKGKIIFQAKCSIATCDSFLDLERKIHLLEQEHFPIIIEKIVLSLN